MPTAAESARVRREFLERLSALDSRAAGDLALQYSKALAKVEAEATRILEGGLLEGALGEVGEGRNPARIAFLAGRAEAIAEEFDRLGAGGARLMQIIAPQAYDLGVAKAKAETSLLGGNFSRPNKRTVEQTLARLQKGTALEDYFARFGRDRTQEAIDTMVESQILGRSVPETVRAMRGKLDLSEARLRTMVRTEALSAARAGTGDSYRENADVIRGWIWNADESPTTCEVCWAMNGTYHDLEEDLDSHPNCRCVQSPATETFDEILAGGGFDPIGEEYESAARPFDADERFDRVLSEEQKIRVLGPGKYRLWRDGEIRLRDLVRPTEHPTWGRGLRATTLRELQGLGVRPAPAIDALAKAEALKDAAPSGPSAWLDDLRREVGDLDLAPMLIHNADKVLRSLATREGAEAAEEMLERVLRIGQIIDDEVQRRIVERELAGLVGDLARVVPLRAEADELSRVLVKWSRDIDRGRRNDWEEYNAEVRRLRRLREEIRDIGYESGRPQAEIMREVLEEAGVEFGGTLSTVTRSGEALQSLRRIEEWIPARWIERSNLDIYSLRLRWSEARGSYGHGPRFGTRYGDLKTGSDATTLHEMMHRVENTADYVMALQHVFYRWRTTGRNIADNKPEPLRRLSETGGNYRRDEVFREDEFATPYMGKWYSDFQGVYGYETLTMGWANSLVYGEYVMDAEMRRFILALLLVG